MNWDISENAFWWGIWGTVAIVLVILISCISWYNAKEVSYITMSPDHVRAACALRINHSDAANAALA